MSYQQACKDMTEAIRSREEAIDHLDRAIHGPDGRSWLWGLPTDVQLALGLLIGSQIRFKNARAEVLGTGSAAHSAQNQETRT